MTTIAYKDGVIAYDSQITQGPTISDSNFDKCVTKGKLKFFMSGCTSDYDEFCMAYLENRPTRKGLSASALLFEDGECYELGTDDDDENDCGIWKHKITSDTAIGSGNKFAYAAMDMGASAKKAVQIAANRDIYTGGRIRTFKV